MGSLSDVRRDPSSDRSPSARLRRVDAMWQVNRDNCICTALGNTYIESCNTSGPPTQRQFERVAPNSDFFAASLIVISTRPSCMALDRRSAKRCPSEDTLLGRPLSMPTDDLERA